MVAFQILHNNCPVCRESMSHTAYGKILPDEINIIHSTTVFTSIMLYIFESFQHEKRFFSENLNISLNKYVQRYVKLHMHQNIRAYKELCFCDYICIWKINIFGNVCCVINDFQKVNFFRKDFSAQLGISLAWDNLDCVLLLLNV